MQFLSRFMAAVWLVGITTACALPEKRLSETKASLNVPLARVTVDSRLPQDLRRPSSDCSSNEASSGAASNMRNCSVAQGFAPLHLNEKSAE